MAQDSKIEWCKSTINWWHGCTKVHEGCENCYAEVLSHRWKNDLWGNDKPRKEIKSAGKDLERFQKIAKEADETHRIFVGSMMDIFEKPMPLIDSKGNELDYTTGDLRNYFFKNIDTAPNLMFLLLTKRPSNINKYIPESWKTNPPENVMFGYSPVNQETANTGIIQLLKVKGKKFLSIEPQLAEIDLRHLNRNSNFETDCLTGTVIHSTSEGVGAISHEEKINWVICGGESGHHKRPFDCDWARKIRDDCKATKVPFFMKQIDKIQTIPDDLLIREFYE